MDMPNRIPRIRITFQASSGVVLGGKLLLIFLGLRILKISYKMQSLQNILDLEFLQKILDFYKHLSPKYWTSLLCTKKNCRIFSEILWKLLNFHQNSNILDLEFLQKSNTFCKNFKFEIFLDFDFLQKSNMIFSKF